MRKIAYKDIFIFFSPPAGERFCLVPHIGLALTEGNQLIVKEAKSFEFLPKNI